MKHLLDREQYLATINEDNAWNNSLLGMAFNALKGGILGVFRWVGGMVTKDAKMLIIRGKALEWLALHVEGMDEALKVYHNKTDDTAPVQSPAEEKPNVPIPASAPAEDNKPEKEEKPTTNSAYQTLKNFYIDILKPLLTLRKRYDLGREDTFSMVPSKHNKPLEQIGDYNGEAVLKDCIKEYSKQFASVKKILDDENLRKKVEEITRNKKLSVERDLFLNWKLMSGKLDINNFKDSDELRKFVTSYEFPYITTQFSQVATLIGKVLNSNESLNTVLRYDEFLLEATDGLGAMSKGIKNFDHVLQEIQQKNYPKDTAFKQAATDAVNVRALKIVEFEVNEIIKKKAAKDGTAQIDANLKSQWERYKLKADNAVRLYVDVDEIYDKVSQQRLSGQDEANLRIQMEKIRNINAYDGFKSLSASEVLKSKPSDFILLSIALGDKDNKNLPSRPHDYVGAFLGDANGYHWFGFFGCYNWNSDKEGFDFVNPFKDRTLSFKDRPIYMAVEEIKKSKPENPNWGYFYTKDGYGIIQGTAQVLTPELLNKYKEQAKETIRQSGSRYVTSFESGAFNVPTEYISKFGLSVEDLKRTGSLDRAKASHAAFINFIKEAK